MLCEKCGKNKAAMHIRSVVNGKVFEKHLCNHCAILDGYNDLTSNDLSQMLFSAIDNKQSAVQQHKVAQCKCCGMTFADISKSGKCGCAECYTTFYEELLPYLKRVHGSTQHIGKIPQTENQTTESNIDKVNKLRDYLNLLIKEEKYEQAAVVRDQIKALEGEK